MSISFDKALGPHPAALQLRGQRAQVLAENLVNADTPNFKARDFDFQAAMKQAQGAQPGSLQVTNAKHMQPSAPLPGQPLLQYRVPQSPALDGNTVEMHTEQSKFAENSVHYQASLTFLGKRFQSMIGALKGE